MRVALFDADKTGYPNLALMKLSAHFKSRGIVAEWYREGVAYDRVYASKVFTYTEDTAPEGAIKGGTGYNFTVELPQHVEHLCPDYELYGLEYSLGFLTRGCDRRCPHCFVHEKEGAIRANADYEEFVRHEKAVFMDNNVLACEHGLLQIERLANAGVAVDFNQGLDARRIDRATARLLKRLKWMAPLRLACDTTASMQYVYNAVKELRYQNVTPSRYFAYLLVGDVAEALERVRFLKTISVDPFAQPFRDKDGTPPTPEQVHFARWVNHKAEFKSQTWEEYRDRKLKIKE